MNLPARTARPLPGLPKVAGSLVGHFGRTSMIRITAVVAAVAIGATAVYAQNLDAIKKRRDVMKAIATAGTVNFNMMKGDIPFDLAKVQAGLKTYQEEATKLPGLFPDDSKTGGD